MQNDKLVNNRAIEDFKSMNKNMIDHILKLVQLVLIIVSCGMVIYHLSTTQILLQGIYEHLTIHLGFAMVIVFLISLIEARTVSSKFISMIFILISIIIVLYIMLNFERLEVVVGFPNIWDVFIGILMIIAVLEGCRRVWGPVLPIIALFAILYFIFGHYLPGSLQTKQYSLPYVISQLSVGFRGIYMLLSVSANQVFLFLVFGALLALFGANRFFLEVGKVVSNLIAGGPAQVAIVSSSLVGMVTGSAAANVALTGAYTIPLMKNVGYTPEEAGAIEAVASTGGQIMPPIMAAAAFLLADFLGMHYFEIMVASIIPAFLYFAAVMFTVWVMARKKGFKRSAERVNFQELKRSTLIFVIPLAVIIILLYLRYTPMYAAFFAILGLLIVTFLFDWKNRPSIKKIINGFADGGILGAKICLAFATVGITAQVMMITGVGIKFGSVIENIAGNNLIISLFLASIVTIILGCGLPTVAAYCLVAITVVPLIVKLGVLPLTAHYFAFFFAVISAITPPVAMASLTGSNIAKANYFRTGLTSFKIALPAILLIFLIPFNPFILLLYQDPWTIIMCLVCIPVFVACLAFANIGWMFTSLSLIERGYLVVSSLVLLYTFASHHIITFVIALFMAVSLFVIKYLKAKNIKEAS